MRLFLYIPDAFLSPKNYILDRADIKRAERDVVLVLVCTVMLAKARFLRSPPAQAGLALFLLRNESLRHGHQELRELSISCFLLGVCEWARSCMSAT
jgi:hypothetical protein